MPNEEIAKRIDALEQKIDAIYASSEKTRKYFLTTLVVSAVVVLLPMLGLMFAIPSFMSSYNDMVSFGELDLEGL
jgi:hypothetical protein